MKKKTSIVLGAVGLVCIVILVLILSGENISNGPGVIVKEADIGGDGTQIQYITAPSEENLKVSITNVTKISNTTNTAEITVYALNIEGENGKLPENYENYIIKSQNFKNLNTNGFEGNITYEPGVKSFGFVTNNIKAHVIILKR